jgi:hypothetical protein
MRARERIKEVKEGSWTCCGTKKRHGRAGAVAGGRQHAWWLWVTAARRGGVGKNQQGSGERQAGELEGQVSEFYRLLTEGYTRGGKFM